MTRSFHRVSHLATAVLMLVSATATRGAAQASTPVRSGTLPEASLYQLPGTWTAHDGRAMDLSNLRGEAVVLAMVYTSCTMTCPLITSEMLAVQRALPPALRSRVRFVLASFDPARDSVGALRAHVVKMTLDGRWLALRAAPATVRQLSVLLGVRYRQLPGGDFDHSNIISVLDADGVLRHQSLQIPADRPALVRAVTAATRTQGL